MENKKVNNLWVFGDSFSAELLWWDSHGNELEPPHPYWFSLVANHFNLNCINKAMGGRSTNHIIHDIIQNINRIKPKDKIVIGQSQCNRDILPLSTATKMGLIGDVESHDGQDVLSMGGIYGDDRNELSDLWNMFLIEFRHNNGREIGRFHERSVQSLKSHFEFLGAECFVWDAEEWGEHERWFEYTNDVIKDGHWSPNGHKSFSIKVIEYFEKKI